MRSFTILLRIGLALALVVLAVQRCRQDDRRDIVDHEERIMRLSARLAREEVARRRAAGEAVDPPPSEDLIPFESPPSGAILPPTSGLIVGRSDEQCCVVTVDGRGEPLGDVAIEVKALGQGRAARYEPRTDARGRTWLTLEPGRDYVVEARQGDRAARRTLKSPHPRDLRLELVPSLDFEVRVREEEGYALEGLRLFVSERRDDPPALIRGGGTLHFPERRDHLRTTDREGRARLVIPRDLWDWNDDARLELWADLLGGKELLGTFEIPALVSRRETIEITMPRPRRRSFRVVAKESPGERFEVSWKTGREILDAELTDGRIRVEAGETFVFHLVPEATEFDLILRSPRREATLISSIPLPKRWVDRQDLTPGPAFAEWSLLLVDEAGKPVAAEIEALPPVDHDPASVQYEGGGIAVDRSRRRAWSGPDGRMTLRLPASWGEVRLQGRVGNLRLPEGLPRLTAGSQVDLGRIVFERGPIAAAGHVRDAKGQPIAGARVRILSRDSYRQWEVHTGKKGEFLLEAPVAFDDGQPLRLAVFTEGYLAARPAGVHFGTRDLDIQLEPSAIVRGILDFREPRLRRHLELEILEAESRRVVTTVIPNLEGEFRTDRLGAGKHVLRVRWDRDEAGERAEEIPFVARAGKIVDIGRHEVARGYEWAEVRIEKPSGELEPYADFVLREEGGTIVLRDSVIPSGVIDMILPRGRRWTLEVKSIDHGEAIERHLRPPFRLRFPAAPKDEDR